MNKNLLHSNLKLKFQNINSSFMLKMMVTALFVWFTLPLSAQQTDPKVTINLQNTTLDQLIKAIEKQTDYKFMYRDDIIDKTKTFSINCQQKPMRELLSEVLAKFNLEYKISDNTIMLSVKIHPTGRLTVNGKVVNETKHPVIGATVIVAGTSQGAITDENGMFRIVLHTPNDLEVSSIGYHSQKIAVATSTDAMIITLKQDIINVDDVIVTGYQTLSARENASAVKKLRSEEFRLDNKMSISQSLEGQVAGMLVVQSSGEPSATPKIRIRGTSTIYSNKAPIWVLDGIILEDNIDIDYSQLGGDDAAYLVGNAIAGINPRDIESITVLKDASATALYGVRAANGVIVVKTLSGTEGRPQLRYTGSLTLNQRPSNKDFEMMNASERIQLSQEMIAEGVIFKRTPMSGIGYEGKYLDYLENRLSYSQFEADVKTMANRNTDWYDILYRDAFSHNHNISLAGGGNGATYYASVGVTEDQGTPRGSNSRRYTTMLKTGAWLDKNKNKVYIGFQANGNITLNRGFHSSMNVQDYAYNTSRTIPAYNEDGTPFRYSKESDLTLLLGEKVPRLTYSILDELKYTGNEGRTINLPVQMNFRWNIWKGLRYEFLGGYTFQQTKTHEYAREESHYVGKIRGYDYNMFDGDSQQAGESNLPVGGVISQNNYQQESYVLRNTIAYSGIIKDKHVLGAQFTNEITANKGDGLSGTYYGWLEDRGNSFSPKFDMANSVKPGNFTNIYKNPILNLKEENKISVLGSVHYTYDQKLILNANIRSDATNQFGSNPKYRFLPTWSVAGKYILSEERFMKTDFMSKIFNEVAVRASYGIAGNVDPATSPDLVLRTGNLNSLTGLYNSYYQYIANPNLRWEKTTSYNLGLDFGMLNNRITATVDYYMKKGEDLIMTKSISQTSGVPSVKINSGNMNNYGVEGSLRLWALRKKDADVILTLNYGYNNNKLTKANSDKAATVEDKLKGQALIEGQSVGTLYSFAYAGLDGGSGYPYFYDSYGYDFYINKNGTTTPNYDLHKDNIMLRSNGVLEAPHAGGFDLSARYKQLRLSMGFTYQFGGHARLPKIYQTYDRAFDVMQNCSRDIIGRWKSPGDEANTNIPVIYNYNNRLAIGNDRAESFLVRPVYEGLEMYDQSDIRVAKTDMLRLRNITLGYTLPRSALGALGLESITISGTVTNLFMATSKQWNGKDPNESTLSNAPLPKTFTLNLTLNF